MGFVIKKIVVHSEPTRVRGGEAHYNMVREKWDVRNLLEVFSREYSHKDFCLAHLFTDLKFEGGILGLAYVGSPRRNSVGGICTPEYFKNGYTLYLNSGLSSSRNHYGQRVITREADLVTAHEFGHNWGSEHDPDIPECSPSASQGGSYLMYTYSVSGYDVNNKVNTTKFRLHIFLALFTRLSSRLIWFSLALLFGIIEIFPLLIEIHTKSIASKIRPLFFRARGIILR